MKKFPIALQLYSVRDELAADFEGTLKAVKEMGYDGVEFAGLCGLAAAEVRALCEKNGLVPISAHVPYADMVADADGVISTYKEIGCKYIVIPYLTPEYRPGEELFGEVIETAKSVGAKATENGLTLLYHNHDFEFVKLDGEYALDILYKEVPASSLQTELDMCWVNVGGEKPDDYLRKYAGRAPVVHLKDFVGGKTENMYALIGIDENEKKETGGKFEFRPCGSGVQDFTSILEAAEFSGAEWVVVEQDNPSMGKAPLECAKMSIDHISSLMA